MVMLRLVSVFAFVVLICTAHVSAICRSEVMKRAKVWVKDAVPWDIHKTYQGYRTDCSGYVAMAWELPKPGPAPSGLIPYVHSISKNQLKDGDILLDTSIHVAIFGGWQNSDQSQYMCYEEGNESFPTRAKVTPYPYWSGYGHFSPYRFTNITDNC
eukprot:TRINITY_DN1102_c0_g1_i2.p1 TRINITY_DN1102_c0_g1~~TRINITY_DN1102_c0_g1_i2.p1  ORF type:complete len:156 (-),score=26.81 TRINITY_DN1102_c0_g1_i2:99-566(-)